MTDQQQTPGQQLAPGLNLSDAGEVTVAPELADVLFDLALKLEESTDLPVDVQHVVAAVLLASRGEGWDSAREFAADDDALVAMLTEQVREVFSTYGGEVSSD